MSRRWLVKSEPSAYSYDTLSEDGRAVWDGVVNSLALRHLGAMAAGDEVLVYHSGNEKAIVGVARVARAAYPDPDVDDARRLVVDLVPVRHLPRTVSLSQLKREAAVAEWELVRMPRLSVMPVPDEAWDVIERLAGERHH
jgi:predicted RNA-binding protein with PUA-like domain